MLQDYRCTNLASIDEFSSDARPPERRRLHDRSTLCFCEPIALVMTSIAPYLARFRSRSPVSRTHHADIIFISGGQSR